MNLRRRLVWLIAILLMIVGCQDSGQSSKSEPVRRKIVAQLPAGAVKQQPSVIQSNKELPNNYENNTLAGGKLSSAESSSPDPATALIKSENAPEKYHYHATLDPFRPLIEKEKEQPTPPPVEIDKPVKKKRIPQTPLERVDLSQLTLTAVFRDDKRSMAMVEESTGKGYIVKNGTYIGLDGGKITKISKDRILITETSEDVMGKPVTVERELKLRQFSGE